MVDHKLYGSRAEFDTTIDGVLEEFGVELVCLAGFMRILTGTFVKKWNGTGVLFQCPCYKERERGETTPDTSISIHREAPEHPPLAAAVLQGCERPEASPAGGREDCRLHSPLCGGESPFACKAAGFFSPGPQRLLHDFIDFYCTAHMRLYLCIYGEYMKYLPK